MCDSKKCSKCGEVKPLTDFHKDKAAKDGRRPNCKSCQSLRDKAYRQANKDRIAKYNKAYYEANKEYHKTYRENNKDRKSETNKAWYEANKEHVAARNKTWYDANKERAAEARKAYREANKDRMAEYRKTHYEANKGTLIERARARNRGLIESIPEGQEDEVNRIWRERPDGYHVDHIYPFSKGGPTSVDNLCYLPDSINLSKRDKLPEGRILHEMLLKHAIIPAVKIP